MFNKQNGNRNQKRALNSFYLLPVAVCLTSPSVWATPLQNWQYDSTANRLEVTVKDGVKPRYFLMAQPARIVLDLPDTEIGSVQTQKTFEGAIRQIRVSQFQPGLTRIVLELSPDTVLAREQAQLQQVGSAEKSGRWVLRPLLAQPSTQPPIVASPTPNPAPSSTEGVSDSKIAQTPLKAATSTVEPDATDRASTPLPPAENPAQEKPIDIVVSRPNLASARLPAKTAPASSLPSATAPKRVTSNPAPPTPDRFPPGIVPVAPQFPEGVGASNASASRSTQTKPAIVASPTPTEATSLPPAQQVATLPNSQPMPSPTVSNPLMQPSQGVALPLPEVSSSLSIPDSLPPVTAPDTPTRPPTVSVPPLDRRPSPSNTLPDAGSFPSGIPSTSGIGANSSTVSVPPLNSSARLDQPLSRSASIEFGQPLPTSQVVEQPPQAVSYRSSAGVFLPAGTLVSLRYPGTQALPLQTGQPRQEALVLQTPLLDSNGNLIASEGTTVLGRFETSSSGSQFVAQTISLPRGTVAIAAQSDPIGGARKVSDNRLVRNSGIGALAGAILGGLSGGNVFGGAAAGAALTYVTAPKPATIQPGQILQVRLTEDLRQ